MVGVLDWLLVVVVVEEVLGVVAGALVQKIGQGSDCEWSLDGWEGGLVVVCVVVGGWSKICMIQRECIKPAKVEIFIIFIYRKIVWSFEKLRLVFGPIRVSSPQSSLTCSLLLLKIRIFVFLPSEAFKPKCPLFKTLLPVYQLKQRKALCLLCSNFKQVTSQITKVLIAK